MSRTLHISNNLSLPLESVTQTFGVLAKRRAGKSYTARRFVEQLFTAGQQVVISDPKGDWWGIRSSADGKKPGLPIIILGGERGDVPLEAGSGEVVAKLVVQERVSALLDLSLFRKHEVATFMTAFLENLYRLKAHEQYRTPMMLALDEADAIAPQRPMKGEERMLGAAEDIVRRGGQRGIGCMLITQRSAVLNKNVLTQCEVLVALRTIAPQDLDAMNAWIDVHGTPEQRRTLMESLPSLPTGEAWFWSPGWPTHDGIFKRVRVLPIKTFDSGASPKPGEKRKEPKNLADVDLDKLRRQMATTIERARADDPCELRKKIAELERQIKAKSATSAPAKAEGKRVEVPVLTKENLRELREITREWPKATGKIRELHQKVRAMHDAWAHNLKFVDDRITRLLDVIAKAGKSPAPAAPLITATLHARRPLSTPTKHAIGNMTQAAVKAITPVAGGDISLPQQRILEALASFEAMGVSRVRRVLVAFYSGASPRSSAFGNNLGALRARGLIDYPDRDHLTLTDDGRAIAPAAHKIMTNEQLHDAWYAKLPRPQATILRILIELHPAAASRENLAQRAGASATSSAYTNNLGALRSLGAIDYPERSLVCATPLMFPFRE